MALMARLMEAPNATSRLATDASALWELAGVVDQSDSDVDFEGLCALEELVKLTLGHLIPTKDQDRSRKYLDRFHAQLSSSLAEGGDSPDQVGTRCLVKASLSVFWLHRGGLLKPLKEKEITRLRTVHLDRLISDLMYKHGRQAQRRGVALTSNLLLILDCMLEYGDLLSVHEHRVEGRSKLVLLHGSPANLLVNLNSSELMYSMMSFQEDHIKDESSHLITDELISQGLTGLYLLGSYTQDDRETEFKRLSYLLQLLRTSRCIAASVCYGAKIQQPPPQTSSAYWSDTEIISAPELQRIGYAYSLNSKNME